MNIDEHRRQYVKLEIKFGLITSFIYVAEFIQKIPLITQAITKYLQ